MAKGVRRTEADEQKAVIAYCRLAGIPAVHIPNEGKRSYRAAEELREMGMAKGFPDLFIPLPRGGRHGLMIELKRDRKSRVTKEQREWLRRLTGLGYRAEACFGAEEAIRLIREYASEEAKNAAGAPEEGENVGDGDI